MSKKRRRAGAPVALDPGVTGRRAQTTGSRGAGVARGAVFFLLFFFLGSITAVPSQAARLALAEALDTAQRQSPEIQQAEAQYDSALEKVGFALAPAEPSLSLSLNDTTQPFGFGPAASKVIQVSQPIGFPGRALLNRSMFKELASASNAQLRALRLQVGVNVKAAYYGLQLARKNIELNSDTRLAYERISSVAKRRYESGAAAQVDYLNAQVALLSNSNDLSDLEASERQARAQMNVLLKRPVAAPLDVDPIAMAYHPKVELDEAIEQMLANRHEIAAARAAARAAERAYHLAWYQLLPDFQLTLGTTIYNNRFASPYSSDADFVAAGSATWPTETYQVGVQITVPIWFLFNERHAIEGAARDRAAAERGLEIAFNQSKVALESAVDAIRSSEAKIERFERHILPMAEQSLNLALIDYSSGKIDFLTLAASAAARRQARLSYATAVVAYLTSYATYGELIGEELK
jgi:outer membrane protein TolC